MHEDPPVFNYGTPDRGLRLRKGMTIAIEPMISAGDWHITATQTSGATAHATAA